MARYLVIYYDGDSTKAKLIDDDDGGKFPYGVEPEMVSDDCEDITAIILCADAPNIPFVVIDDQEVTLDEPEEADDEGSDGE